MNPIKVRPEVEAYYDENQDELHESWNEHCSYMEDNPIEVIRIHGSDACFWEWIEERFDEIPKLEVVK